MSFSIAFHATVRVAACVRIFRGRHASLACLRTSATDDIRSKAAFLRQSWTCACRLQCRPPWNQNWLARKGKLPEETQHYVKTITGRPAENWKAGGAVTPLENVPRQAPCQEAAGVVASSAPQRDQPVTRIRTAPARAKTPVHRGARRERGSTQLAAASKKRHQKVRLSQR